MAAKQESKPVKPLGWLWATGIALGLLACLPSMFEALCAKTYATHRHGVAVVTCASSPMGKAAVEALIEDGYLVRCVPLRAYAATVCGRARNEYGAPGCIHAYVHMHMSFDRNRHHRPPSLMCVNKSEPRPPQVYAGVKTEADAGLLKAVATKREGPVLKPLVLDVNKPESLQAAAAKVKAELGEVRCGFVGFGMAGVDDGVESVVGGCA